MCKVRNKFNAANRYKYKGVLFDEEDFFCD